MSAAYVIVLAASVAVIVSARLLAGSLPLVRFAVPINRVEAVVAGAGAVGLAFHCGSMFFPAGFGRIPGTHRVISEINALGAVSLIWYAVAAALVSLGLRHQHKAALLLVEVALVVVGVTMYDGGPLRVHLAAIFATVLILAGVTAVLVALPPSAGRRRLRRASA